MVVGVVGWCILSWLQQVNLCLFDHKSKPMCIFYINCIWLIYCTLLRTRTQSSTHPTNTGRRVSCWPIRLDSNAEFRMFVCIAFIINANRFRAEPYAWSFEFLHTQKTQIIICSCAPAKERNQRKKNALYLFVCYGSQHHANVAWTRVFSIFISNIGKKRKIDMVRFDSCNSYLSD